MPTENFEELDVFEVMLEDDSNDDFELDGLLFFSKI